VVKVTETYGISGLRDNLIAARVENDGARLQVTALLTAEDKPDAGTMENGRMFFNVDDRLAMIKKIKIRQSPLIELAEIVQFEMSQSLLEPADHFYFDSIPLASANGYNNFLSIAYRKTEIDKLIEAYKEFLKKPSGFKLDAVALTRGYLTFCRPEPGDLQVLVNLEPDKVTLAFIYCGRLHATGCLDISPGLGISRDTAKLLASEFQMVLSYRLSELFQEGITIPPSRIILSGRLAQNELLTAAMKKLASAEITLPHIQEGYFQKAPETIDRYKPEQFLIPLGLAVE
jgi:hypothetical protein